jgi:hypothetical protein
MSKNIKKVSDENLIKGIVLSNIRILRTELQELRKKELLVLKKRKRRKKPPAGE